MKFSRKDLITLVSVTLLAKNPKLSAEEALKEAEELYETCVQIIEKKRPVKKCAS